MWWLSTLSILDGMRTWVSVGVEASKFDLVSLRYFRGGGHRCSYTHKAINVEPSPGVWLCPVCPYAGHVIKQSRVAQGLGGCWYVAQCFSAVLGVQMSGLHLQLSNTQACQVSYCII